MQPSPSRTKTGVPPTPANARTGELTPPGMTCRAFAKAAAEFAVFRAVFPAMVRSGNEPEGPIVETTAAERNAGRPPFDGPVQLPASPGVQLAVAASSAPRRT